MGVKILVLTRRRDMLNMALRILGEQGFEAEGTVELDEALEMIAQQNKKKYWFCTLGCQFVNDEFYRKELQKTTDALDAAGIGYGKMPTFGDTTTLLQGVGLIEGEGFKAKLIQNPVRPETTGMVLVNPKGM